MKVATTFRYYRYPLLFIFFSHLLSCKKFVEVEPPKTKVVTETVYMDDASAVSAINGIYSSMAENLYGLPTGGAALYTGWSSDEFVLTSSQPSYDELLQNELTSSNDIVSNLWTEAYKYIYYANSMLEGLSGSETLDPEIKTQLEGEAKFIRAFIYFYLTNLWGDVPLVLTTDYRTNSTITRTPKSEVYAKMKEDLTSAQQLLKFEYITGERTRPNSATATALLARLCLYNQEWAAAETESSKIIDSVSTYTLLDDLNSVFLANSNEAIWQLAPVQAEFNSNFGPIFIIEEALSDVALREQLVNIFDPTDKRKNDWIGSFLNLENNITYYYPNKYKVRYSSSVSEYNMMFRLSEQYLIRSEARAHLQKINEAQDDINMIRTRAGLENTPANDLQSLQLALETERQLELFSEGHRWFDLIRTERANEVIGSLKNGWQTTDVLYPIPRVQILNNPNMIGQQNPGYN